MRSLSPTIWIRNYQLWTAKVSWEVSVVLDTLLDCYFYCRLFIYLSCIFTRWWFQIFFIFTPTWGRFPFWLIFFKGVETTNQFIMFLKCPSIRPTSFFDTLHLSEFGLLTANIFNNRVCLNKFYRSKHKSTYKHSWFHESQSQTIHVWYIYLHLLDVYGTCR